MQHWWQQKGFIELVPGLSLQWLNGADVKLCVGHVEAEERKKRLTLWTNRRLRWLKFRVWPYPVQMQWRGWFKTFLNGQFPASFCLFLFFSNNFQNKTEDFSGIRPRIVGVEGEHADHLTTTTFPLHICTQMVACEPSLSAAQSYSPTPRSGQLKLLLAKRLLLLKLCCGLTIHCLYYP